VNGENAEKMGNKSGKQWWGKRPLSGLSVSRNKGMKFWKRLLHKKERKEITPDMIWNDENMKKVSDFIKKHKNE